VSNTRRSRAGPDEAQRTRRACSIYRKWQKDVSIPPVEIIVRQQGVVQEEDRDPNPIDDRVRAGVVPCIDHPPGPLGLLQRRQIHKRGNILEHRQARVDRILREAWESTDPDLANCRLENLASSLESEHPSAAASIREGLDATLTLQRLGIEGNLYRTLRSTNTIENLNGSITTYTRNVERWQGGSMMLRWASAAVLDASKRFRRIRGYKDLDRLTRGLEQIEQEQNNATNQQVA
jgi:Transposase, Mutator family